MEAGATALDFDLLRARAGRGHGVFPPLLGFGRRLPIAYGLPVVVSVWFRNRAITWSIVAAFTAIALVKIGFQPPPPDGMVGAQRWFGWTLVQCDLYVIAAFVHYVIGARERAEERGQALQQYSTALAGREEQIIAQNRELQAQAEEMQAQAEELERQTEELRTINEELETRERLLERLLDLSQSLTADLSRPQVAERIARAVEGMIGLGVGTAVAVLERRGDTFHVTAFHGAGEMADSIPAADSLAAVVVARGEIGFVEDLSAQTDVRVPRSVSGPPPRSVLAAPLRLSGGRSATLEIYTRQPHAWSRPQMAVVEALAAQASVSLANAALVEELDRRRREAEDAAVRKTRFLAAVSHDIRTPANAINLVAELLLTVSNDKASRADGDGQREEIPELARELRDAALALVQLVSDVLDVTRYDYGKVELQISDFPLAKLLEDQLRQHRSTAANKGLALMIEPTPRLTLRSDAIKLGRVLSNLLGNAVKFTDSGSVSLGGHVRPDGGLELIVRDTGPGISEEQQPLIFDEFYQVKNPARDRNHGTGLGLAICSRLVDAMSGKLSVVSQLGRGSTFIVTLPGSVVGAIGASANETFEALPTFRAITRDELRGIRVLLVEDHDTTRLAVSQILRGAGAEVVEAPTVAAACARLDDASADALLLDMMLPDGDGREVLARLRESRPEALRAVLVLTGDVTPERIEEVHRLGADALLHKPIDPQAVVTLLKERCGGKGKPETRNQKPEKNPND